MARCKHLYLGCQHLAARTYAYRARRKRSLRVGAPPPSQKTRGLVTRRPCPRRSPLRTRGTARHGRVNLRRRGRSHGPAQAKKRHASDAVAFTSGPQTRWHQAGRLSTQKMKSTFKKEPEKKKAPPARKRQDPLFQATPRNPVTSGRRATCRDSSSGPDMSASSASARS